MGHGVVGKRMPFRRHAPHQSRMSCGVAPDQEEGGPRAMELQGVEDTAGRAGQGTVIQCQHHFAVSEVQRARMALGANEQPARRTHGQGSSAKLAPRLGPDG